MSSNLEYWMDNIASFPAQKDGKWVDLDGAAPDFDASIDYVNAYSGARKPRSSVPSKYAAEIKEARDSAKKQGYASLTGSTKQKQWAVQIRDQRVSIIPDDLKDFATSEILKSSKFWIETREMGVDAFVTQLKKLYEMHMKRWELHERFESLIPDEIKPGQGFALTVEQSQIRKEIEKLGEAMKIIIDPPEVKQKFNPPKRC